MGMLMRRMSVGEFTVHGMRRAARSWMADTGVAHDPHQSAPAARSPKAGAAAMVAASRGLTAAVSGHHDWHA
jgi:hypothetical protein